MTLLQKAASFLVRRLNLTDPAGWSSDQSHAGVPVNEGSVLALSAVWACVNLLAGTIASLPLVIYRTDARGSRTVAKDHPLYRVLRDSPNFDQTAMDFWEGGAAALELRGNLHARIERAGGRVIALHPIFNPAVRRLPDGSLRYRWSEDGKTYDEPQENVFHVRGFGGSPLGGLSTLSYGRQAFGLQTAINTAAQTTFANGVRASGVMTMQKFLTGDQRGPVEKALQDKYAGAMNAGRPMLLEGGMTWQQITINPDDAQMLESRNFGVEEIARFFGVPPHMIGHTAGNTQLGSSIEEQGRGFEKFTLRKRLKRIEQAAMKQLLTPADRAAGITIEFNLEGLFRGDSKGRAAFYQSGLQNGWMTINEVRALENMPAVAGGEVPRMQLQNVPISDTIQANPVRLPEAQS